MRFQYRKRYEITCDAEKAKSVLDKANGFNTASGMRSHVTSPSDGPRGSVRVFQYRKRYEITCDKREQDEKVPDFEFQYRKRYEITCDTKHGMNLILNHQVSIPQAV